MLFILLLVFIGITLIQLVYYVFIFGQFSFAKKQTIQPKKLPISIIICAKNEEENIKNKLFIYYLSLAFPSIAAINTSDKCGHGFIRRTRLHLIISTFIRPTFTASK